MAEDNYINKDNTISYYASVTSSYVKAVIKPLPPEYFEFQRHLPYFTGTARTIPPSETGGGSVSWNPSNIGMVLMVSGSRMVFTEERYPGGFIAVIDRNPGADGHWRFSKYLTSSDGGFMPNNSFGESWHPLQHRPLLLHKDLVVVGDTREVPDPAQASTNYHGAFYVFASRSNGGGDNGDGWVRTRVINTDIADYTGAAGYGTSFAITNNQRYLFVGSRGANERQPPLHPGVNQSPKGAVYVYDLGSYDFFQTGGDGTGSYDGGYWDGTTGYVQYITGSDALGHGASSFGMGMAFDHSIGGAGVLTIGGYGYASVYASNSAEGWYEIQHLISEQLCNRGVGSEFGYGARIDADAGWLIIGAPGDHNSTAAQFAAYGYKTVNGSATIFKWNGSQYVRHTALTGSGQYRHTHNNVLNYFGQSVSIASSSFGIFAGVCQQYAHSPAAMSGALLIYKYNPADDDWDYDASQFSGSRYMFTGSDGLPSVPGASYGYVKPYGWAQSMWSDGDKGLKIAAGSPEGVPWGVEEYYYGYNYNGIPYPTATDLRGIITIHEVSQSIDNVTEIVGFAPPMKLGSRGNFNLRGQTASEGGTQGGGKVHRTFIGEQKS